MTGLTALLFYVLWMVLLVLLYAGPRIPPVLMMKKAADSWTRGMASPDSGFLVRASHAHANCVENLPLFAAVVLAAAAMGQSPVVDAYAALVLYARIGQSTVHLIGTSFILVLMRATLFLFQLGLIAWMAWQLLHPVAVATAS